jgi:pyruvate formate lyase activating enzyme
MLDYPGEMACIVWFVKCNLRCVYCHNPDIVFGEGAVEDATFEAFLEKRRDRLTGVVLSGGEPTFCPEINRYAAMAKQKGYKVKLDTNGSNPAAVRELIEQRLIDMVALDYKAPEAKIEKIAGTSRFVEAHKKTLDLCVGEAARGAIGFEVRTTYDSDFMDEGDLNAMIAYLESAAYAGTYYIQNIVTTGEGTIGQIAEPKRRIDPKLLRQPNGFDLGFRNFKYLEIEKKT